MKRLVMALAWIAAMVAPAAARAQYWPFAGYCSLGATPAVTSGLQSSNQLQGVISQCTVTVYLSGTSTKATIYSDSSGGSLTNSFTATTVGSWVFWAAPGVQYDVTMSGGLPPNTFPAPVTTSVKSGGATSTGCVPSPSTAGYLLADAGSGGCADAANGSSGLFWSGSAGNGYFTMNLAGGGLVVNESGTAAVDMNAGTGGFNLNATGPFLVTYGGASPTSSYLGAISGPGALSLESTNSTLTLGGYSGITLSGPSLQDVALAPSTGTACLQIAATTGLITNTGAACGSLTSNAFSALTSGANTTAAMVVGTGASLAPSGTGTIQATDILGTITAGANVSITGSGTTTSPYSISSTTSGWLPVNNPTFTGTLSGPQETLTYAPAAPGNNLYTPFLNELNFNYSCNTGGRDSWIEETICSYLVPFVVNHTLGLTQDYNLTHLHFSPGDDIPFLTESDTVGTVAAQNEGQDWHVRSEELTTEYNGTLSIAGLVCSSTTCIIGTTQTAGHQYPASQAQGNINGSFIDLWGNVGLGADLPLVDLTQAYTTGAVTNITGAAITGTGTNWDATFGLTAAHTTTTASVQNVGSGVNSFPRSSVTVNVTSSTGFSVSASDPVWFFDAFDNRAQSAHITATGTGTITVDLLNWPIYTGSVVSQGGAAGQCFNMDLDNMDPANMHGFVYIGDQGLSQVIHQCHMVEYNTSGQHLTLYTNPSGGIQYNSTANPSVSGSGAYHLWPAAMASSVVNGGTGKIDGAGIATTPWSRASVVTAGDTIAQFHALTEKFEGLNWQQWGAQQAPGWSDGLLLQGGGTVTVGTNLQYAQVTNANALTLYEGLPAAYSNAATPGYGNLFAGAAWVANGPWATGFYKDTPPFGNYHSVGTLYQGCGAYCNWAGGYPILNAQNNLNTQQGEDILNYTPVDGSWKLTAGSTTASGSAAVCALNLSPTGGASTSGSCINNFWLATGVNNLNVGGSLNINADFEVNATATGTASTGVNYPSYSSYGSIASWMNGVTPVKSGCTERLIPLSNAANPVVQWTWDCGGVGAGGATAIIGPDSNMIGEVLPTYTSDPIVTLPDGTLYYNTAIHSTRQYQNSAWVTLGGISGLTTGYLPLAGSSTTITSNSHINDGVTTASTLTATEAFVFNAAGAASVPSVDFTGAPYAGTATTSVPGVYINQGASAPTTWSTATTEFGINAVSGFAGNFIDLHLNGGASVFKVGSTGNVTAAGTGTFGTVNYGGAINVTGCGLTGAAGKAYTGMFTSGTTGVCTVTITLGATTTNGFFCKANNLTTPANAMLETATNSTTATISGTTSSGDVINFSCDPNGY